MAEGVVTSKAPPPKEVFPDVKEEAIYGHLYDDYDYDYDSAIDIDDDVTELNPEDH